MCQWIGQIQSIWIKSITQSRLHTVCNWIQMNRPIFNVLLFHCKKWFSYCIFILFNSENKTYSFWPPWKYLEGLWPNACIDLYTLLLSVPFTHIHPYFLRSGTHTSEWTQLAAAPDCKYIKRQSLNCLFCRREAFSYLISLSITHTPGTSGGMMPGSWCGRKGFWETDGSQS